ncbi:FAD binding domain-containing protein [Metabacillus herbersteinensis]|uniref:FAD binding domain-containing protein n=1 Tax=Metabacillus herbersteinensis TaxID=283816 RepID=A0ABV6GGI4_9BACI
MISPGGSIQNSPIVWVPDKLGDAWQIKQQFGLEGIYIAGGTLLQTQWAKGTDPPSNLISLERIKEMQGWGKELVNGETYTRIGALMTLDFCRHDPTLLKEIPLLGEAVRMIAAPAIRNKATIGGNIAYGFGDAIPLFLAMDAILSLFDGKEIHLKSLWDYVNERESLSNSILICVYIPDKIASAKEINFYKKVGHREALSPSVVSVSGCCQFNEKNEVEHIRLAVSGSLTPPQRLVRCEQLIKGSPLSNDLLKKLVQTIKEEFIPSTDDFSSADYKEVVAANLIVSEIARLAG